ncbi:Uncharacterized protein LSUE1_G008713 [Lachnellula suecica]|uniref:Carbonic anhydrase n=1 Tax=Lachnellula suecica TaxID=602035 RepID=A0A8T9BXI2_9HELO|nr:Uncharacterized protein LSUE1_G008713 [Lachnellula suecica]
MSNSKLAYILTRNATYAQKHTSPGSLLARINARKSAGIQGTVIISCSDPRIPPETFLALEKGEAAIIRNAGGRTRDAVRSLVALDAVGNLGTIIVVHHTDCGMSHTDEAGFRAKTEARHPGIAASEPGLVFGAIRDPEETVVEDVEFLKSFPGFGEQMDVVGLVLDTHTGLVKQVV